MGLFRSNTARLLEEYPWLWAVSNHWTGREQIFFEYPQFGEIAMPSIPTVRWWARFGDARCPDFGEVREIKFDYAVSIGHNVGRSIRPDEQLSHIIWHDQLQGDIKPYTVYRSGRWPQTLHSMCATLADSEYR
jgi:hypothetical protein